MAGGSGAAVVRGPRGGGMGSVKQRGFSLNPKDYKLMEEVGHGASAVVYRAIYLPTNEVVAIKCLDLDRCNSNLMRYNFEVEDDVAISKTKSIVQKL